MDLLIVFITWTFPESLIAHKNHGKTNYHRLPPAPPCKKPKNLDLLQTNIQNTYYNLNKLQQCMKKRSCAD